MRPRSHFTYPVAAVLAGALAIGSGAAAQTTGRASHAGTFAARAAAARTPILIAGSYHGRRPRTIAISADGGNIVGGLHWSRWGTRIATGRGTSDIQSCVPDCVSGTDTPVATTITLSRPQHGDFTRLVERRAGHTETFVYTPGHRPDNWPLGATG